jgi:hypothetical protein
MKRIPKKVYKVRSKSRNQFLASNYLTGHTVKWANDGIIWRRYGDVLDLIPRQSRISYQDLDVDFDDLEIVEIELTQTELRQTSITDALEDQRREEVFKKKYGYSAYNMLCKIKKEGLHEFRYMFILGTRNQTMTETHSRLRELGLNRTKYRFHSSIVAFRDKNDAILARLALADETLALFDFETLETL